ncbi:hypothetical protein PMZ80_009377 [Knufia obscura]|uniref:Urease accessory protein UreD n=2 Tax=Knufia TaxID=430999 RepID=A0AAN8I9P0_9EURO|nr:hypothetical protein PMZ80_009377 [Knufia obscura]KAK5955836.1 hypothetical protein OHC33_003477 [Knufia fluminis]
MATRKSPFAKSRAKPGDGEIVVSLLPPGKQVLTTFEYQYPLKLISPDQHTVTVKKPHHDAKLANDSTAEVPVTTVFLLTYGGGLLAGDSINLTVNLEPHTRLALLTQGSTKIFKSETTSPSTTTTTSTLNQTLPTISPFTTPPTKPTSQTLNVKISAHSSLCYLPDPSQPFAKSTYTQSQTFYLSPHGSSSLLLLDWVTEGRPALNESWTLTSWKGRNEIREFDPHTKGRLLIRDALHLFTDDIADLNSKTDGKGIIGTLIIHGPTFKSLSEFFLKEFKTHPRLGAKNWSRTPRPHTPTIREEDDSGGSTGGGDYFTQHKSHSSGATTPRAKARKEEEIEGLLWTAASVRGFVLVKFGAKEVDGARRWLGGMLRREGSVEREFGRQATLCLR